MDRLEVYFASRVGEKGRVKMKQRGDGLAFRLMGKTANYVTRYVLRLRKGYTHGSTKTPT